MLGGRGARQARLPGRPSCAGGAGCQAGKVARQARLPGRRGRQEARLTGEAARRQG